MKPCLVGIAALSALALVNAECPNACSGHGTCGCKDQCTCYKGWQGNDCSEATCAFGLAHVDTPIGNLDGDTDYTLDYGAKNVVGSQVYPQGTYERYPKMLGAEEGHYYMECSNKGICDRETGLCQCFEGYEGTACKRAACPNACSGHGTCESIKEFGLAEWTLHADYHAAGTASYDLWDADVTMGCQCDAQFFGADCSLRKCKYGMDPLYWTEDDGEVIIDLNDAAGGVVTLANTFTLGFYTHNTTETAGTLYTTAAFTPVVHTSANAVGQCDSLINTLLASTDENSNTVTAAELKGLECTAFACAAGASAGVRYRLNFDKNPGILSTLHFTTFSVTGQTTPSNLISYRPTGSCTAMPVLEEIVLLYKDTSTAIVGDYRLKFYDVFGEDYITDPITVAQFTTSLLSTTEDICNSVVSKLINLPNGVISDVTCAVSAGTAQNLGNGAIVRLKFHKNPGVLKPVEVFSTNLASTGSVTVGAGATTGEFVDRFASNAYDSQGGDMYVGSLQNGATTSIDFMDLTGTVIASGNSATNTLLVVNNLIKINDRHLIVSAVSTTACDVKWMYTGSDILAGTTGHHPIFYSRDTWSTLQTPGLVDITAAWTIGAKVFTASADASASLTKGALIFVENQYFTVQYASPVASPLGTNWQVYVDRPFGGTQVEVTYNSGTAVPLDVSTSNVYYRSTTATVGTYTYVSPCSNRGTCDYATGTCACYKGYSNDNCDTVNSLMA